VIKSPTKQSRAL